MSAADDPGPEVLAIEPGRDAPPCEVCYPPSYDVVIYDTNFTLLTLGFTPAVARASGVAAYAFAGYVSTVARMRPAPPPASTGGVLKAIRDARYQPFEFRGRKYPTAIEAIREVHAGVARDLEQRGRVDALRAMAEDGIRHCAGLAGLRFTADGKPMLGWAHTSRGLRLVKWNFAWVSVFAGAIDTSLRVLVALSGRRDATDRGHGIVPGALRDCKYAAVLDEYRQRWAVGSSGLTAARLTRHDLHHLASAAQDEIGRALRARHVFRRPPRTAGRDLQWCDWYAQDMTPKEIARLHRELTGERVKPDTVKHALRRAELAREPGRCRLCAAIEAAIIEEGDPLE